MPIPDTPAAPNRQNPRHRTTAAIPRHRRRPTPVDLAHARHIREWAAIATETALSLIRAKRTRPARPARPILRRLRTRKQYDGPLLWQLAQRYNHTGAHTHGLCTSLRLWECNGLTMHLGNVYWGLRHILTRHGANFAAFGVAEDRICEIVKWHVEHGTPLFGDCRSWWYRLVGATGGEEAYLCVVYMAGTTGVGPEPGSVLSAYPATGKRLYMECRRNKDLKRVSGVSALEDRLGSVLGEEPETQVSELRGVNDTLEDIEPSLGVRDTTPQKTQLVPDPAIAPISAIVTPKPDPTTTAALETTPAPKKRFKIKHVWHSFTTPQIRRLYLTSAEADALPGTAYERMLRHRFAKPVHSTIITVPSRSPPTIIIPSPPPPPAAPARASRIHRYSPEKEGAPPKLAHRVAVRPYAPRPRVHRTRAPPYRPRPRITKFITRKKVVRRVVRGRPFVPADRSDKLRRATRTRQRIPRARRKGHKGWSVTRGTPRDVLAVLGALVRARKGAGTKGVEVDRRAKRAGVLGLLGVGGRGGRAFPRLGGGVMAGAGRIPGRWTPGRVQARWMPGRTQVRPVHTRAAVVARPPRILGMGVGLPAVWRRFAGRFF